MRTIILYHKKISSFIFASVLLLVSGCKLPSIQGNDPAYPLPETYQGTSDTSNTANLSWKQFYASSALRDLIDTVLMNNQDMLMAVQKIEFAKAQYKQSSGQLLPQLNGLISPSLRKFGLYTMDGAGNIVTDMQPGKLVPIDLPDYYLGFQTSWEADLWGKLKNRKRAAMARALSTEAYRHLLQTNLIAETAMLYYDLLAVDQEIRTIDQTIEIQSQALELVRIQKEAAVVNELAVQQFEAQLLGMKSMRVQAMQRIIEAEARLNMLTGKTMPTIKRDTSLFRSQPLPLVQAGIPGQLILNRPDIKQSELELMAARADLRSARAAFLPSLMITGGLGVQAYLPKLLTTFPESIAYSFIGGLAGPLINRININAEFAKANAMQKESLLGYQKTLLKGFLEVDQELKKNKNLTALFELKDKEVNMLSAAVDVSSELFKTGRSTYLEVLFARQNQLRSNLELIETRKAQWISTVHLYKALGGGWK